MSQYHNYEDEKQLMMSRWRLVLGKFAQDQQLSDGDKMTDDCLSFLYDREYLSDRGIREESDGSSGGLGKSKLFVPDWLNRIKKLFPKKTVEILQKDALNKYEINEMLTDPELLKKLEPNVELLGKLLSFRGAIPKKVRSQADEMIKKISEEISRRLESDVKKNFYGKKSSGYQTNYKIFKNFDFKKTVEMNLKNYSSEYKTVIAKQLYFNNTVKRYNPWDIILLVDQSGSMVNSTIYAAVMSGIFASIPFLSVKFVAFDTDIVDLSEYAQSASDILFRAQLGGGTDIYKALCYCEQLITKPLKTIIVLISDLYEGREIRGVYRKCADIMEGGSKLMVLPALDYDSNPTYWKEAGQTLANIGAEVAAITPEEMAEWIGNIIT